MKLAPNVGSDRSWVWRSVDGFSGRRKGHLLTTFASISISFVRQRHRRCFRWRSKGRNASCSLCQHRKCVCAFYCLEHVTQNNFEPSQTLSSSRRLSSPPKRATQLWAPAPRRPLHQLQQCHKLVQPTSSLRLRPPPM